MKRLDRFLRDWRIDKAGGFIRQGSTVLDIGTGDGALFERNKNIAWGVGIDPHISQVLERSHYRLYPGSFPGTFACKKTFDVITMLAVIEHFSAMEYDRVAGRCAQLLRPGGLLIITVPAIVVDAILKIMKIIRLIDGMNLDEHHGFDPRQTRIIFKAPLFRLMHHERFQFGFNNLFVFKRKDDGDVM